MSVHLCTDRKNDQRLKSKQRTWETANEFETQHKAMQNWNLGNVMDFKLRMRQAHLHFIKFAHLLRFDCFIVSNWIHSDPVSNTKPFIFNKIRTFGHRCLDEWNPWRKMAYCNYQMQLLFQESIIFLSPTSILGSIIFINRKSTY